MCCRREGTLSAAKTSPNAFKVQETTLTQYGANSTIDLYSVAQKSGLPSKMFSASTLLKVRERVRKTTNSILASRIHFLCPGAVSRKLGKLANP